MKHNQDIMNFEIFHRMFPNAKYRKIRGYDAEMWTDREYDSSKDYKMPVDNVKMDYEQAIKAVENGYRIGWIVDQGYCVIDVDKLEYAKLIFKILMHFECEFSYNVTFRGIHFIFKDLSNSIKTDSHKKCALNLDVDSRANGTGYIILPINDPYRSWGDYTDSPEDVPYFLKPLMRDQTPTFVGMKDGDGRNDALFKWVGKLRMVHMQKPVIDKCIRIINEYLFSEPMTNEELFSTVLKERDQDAQTVVKENVHEALANKILETHKIASLGPLFYLYKNYYYSQVKELEIEALIHKEYDKRMGNAARQEVLKFIRVKTQRRPEEFDSVWNKIMCKNGLLDLSIGDLVEPDGEILNTIYIPHEFKPKATFSPKIDDFMNTLTSGPNGIDNKKKTLLYEIAGYCLLKKNIFAKLFILKGQGATGKSTFLNILENLVSSKNVSRIQLSDFDKDYSLSMLNNKLVNLADDLDDRILENTGRLKSAVSGDAITTRQIFQEPFTFIPFTTVVLSCNHIPRVMDKTSGFYRRLCLIELDNKIKKPDFLFLEKLSETDYEYFFRMAVEAIGAAIQRGQLIADEMDDDLITKFKLRQSSVNQYVHSANINIGYLHHRRIQHVFNHYKDWCKENGYEKTVTSTTLKEELNTMFNVEVEIKYTDNGQYEQFVHPRFTILSEEQLQFNPFRVKGE